MIDEKKINLILEKIGIIVKERAIRMCPVDMGTLRRSIGYRLEGNKVIIFATSPEAESMEYGSPPEPLSDSEKEDLRAWSKRHNAPPEGMIKAIEKRGIKVGTKENPIHITSFGRDSFRPFMRPALLQSIPDIKRMIQKELENG